MTSRPRCRIAYLSSEYPCVSHTFVRREILGLETLGFDIVRVGIRGGETLVDQDDISEATKTRYVLEQHKGRVIQLFLRGLLLSGWRVIPAFRTTWRLHTASERGLLRHIAYFMEGLILRAILREERADHVHVHFGNNAAAVALLCRLAGGPTYSVTIHGPLEFDAPIGFSLGLKGRHALFLVAITNYCAAQIKRWIPYEDWRKVHIVPCTVDEAWFEQPESDGRCKDIVCVGRLVADKAQILLVDSFSEALKEGIEGNLILVGDGEMREQIESRIRELDISDRVSITGWLSGSDIRCVLRKARGLVLASFAEGLPVVIMEAMASGKPIVSSRITGIPELVIDGQHGWLVTPGDQSQLTSALIEIFTTPESSIQEMGKACRTRVFERHSSAKLELLAELFVHYLSASQISSR